MFKELLVVVVISFFSFSPIVLAVRRNTRFKIQVNNQTLIEENGGDLVSAIFDIIHGLSTYQITVCFDNNTNTDFIEILTRKFISNQISIELFNMTLVESQEKYFEFIGNRVNDHKTSYTIFFCTHKLYEHILLEIKNYDYIRRNIVYIFNWGRQPFQRYFLRNIENVMKVYVITNPRNDTFRVYYSQALSYKTHHLEMVNWWRQSGGLFYHPTLPTRYDNVYKDFNGKIFKIPVLHKPPWHFVKYTNNSMVVLGGRDDRILSLLSRKLNFRYEYIDPPERIQGSSVSENGTFNGVLGLVWKRDVDLFIGDVALTLERSHYVEFSFITLADSGAFVTHAPSKLNEALALLRPFHWQVWPAIAITFIIVGPILYIIITLPNSWRPTFHIRSHVRLLFDCTWFTTTVLLKQTGREPSSSHKARFFTIILSISATYVINDMYSANLTSLLAKPGREKAINNLNQLETAMAVRGYKLYVESHSSFYSLFENGTGIYHRLWRMMNKQQENYLLESVEQGVKMVKTRKNIAVIAGRETLFFDIQRFGPSHFHLSEKLNTAYSAIAFQLGCPYIQKVNRILMSIFEAGIITKMTEDEYKKLGKQKELLETQEETKMTTTTTTTTGMMTDGGVKKKTLASKISEDNEKLQPISLKMLQGAFYLLCIGNVLSGIVLLIEICVSKHQRSFGCLKRRRQICYRRLKRFYREKCVILRQSLRRFYQRLMNDVDVSTLEYVE